MNLKPLGRLAAVFFYGQIQTERKCFVLRLTDPEVNVVEEEAAQDLIQGSIHFQPCRSSHQPLQQFIQLFSHMLRKNPGV